MRGNLGSDSDSSELSSLPPSTAGDGQNSQGGGLGVERSISRYQPIHTRGILADSQWGKPFTQTQDPPTPTWPANNRVSRWVLDPRITAAPSRSSLTPQPDRQRGAGQRVDLPEGVSVSTPQGLSAAYISLPDSTPHPTRDTGKRRQRNRGASQFSGEQQVLMEYCWRAMKPIALSQSPMAGSVEVSNMVTKLIRDNAGLYIPGRNEVSPAEIAYVSCPRVIYSPLAISQV
jgi:hypothetical protein